MLTFVLASLVNGFDSIFVLVPLPGVPVIIFTINGALLRSVIATSLSTVSRTISSIFSDDDWKLSAD
jgi:hypothetical protein